MDVDPDTQVFAKLYGVILIFLAFLSIVGSIIFLVLLFEKILVYRLFSWAMLTACILLRVISGKFLDLKERNDIKVRKKRHL